MPSRWSSRTRVKPPPVLAFAREHFLEGVVVKRADSLYRSGRSTAWQKFKIRHPQRVWVTAWILGRPGELDRYWVGREVRGTLVPSGEVSYGLTPGQASTLRQVLHAADLGSRSRHRLRPVAPAVAMTVAGHGRRSGWLRDPVITAVHIDPSDPPPTPEAIDGGRPMIQKPSRQSIEVDDDTARAVESVAAAGGRPDPA